MISEKYVCGLGCASELLALMGMTITIASSWASKIAFLFLLFINACTCSSDFQKDDDACTLVDTSSNNRITISS